MQPSTRVPGRHDVPARDARLPPIFPEVIYSANLTPHANGIAGYSVPTSCVRIKRGEDPDQDGAPLCPPMPAGPMGAFGGITDEDAADIAHYLLSLPPAREPHPESTAATPRSTRTARRRRTQAQRSRRFRPQRRARAVLPLRRPGSTPTSRGRRSRPDLPVRAGVRAVERRRRQAALAAAAARREDRQRRHGPLAVPGRHDVLEGVRRDGKRLETRLIARTGTGAARLLDGRVRVAR